jgi:hypothetical protein
MEHEHLCASCAAAAGVLRCARCGLAYYCCAACQKKHWKAHKRECQPREERLSKPSPENIKKGDLPTVLRALREFGALDFSLTVACLRRIVNLQTGAAPGSKPKGAGEPADEWMPCIDVASGRLFAEGLVLAMNSHAGEVAL